jgi:hypothetical protein
LKEKTENEEKIHFLKENGGKITVFLSEVTIFKKNAGKITVC